nr:hypothetical protein K-LCC10_0214 [Kaumoebavirus]
MYQGNLLIYGNIIVSDTIVSIEMHIGNCKMERNYVRAGGLLSIDVTTQSIDIICELVEKEIVAQTERKRKEAFDLISQITLVMPEGLRSSDPIQQLRIIREHFAAMSEYDSAKQRFERS